MMFCFPYYIKFDLLQIISNSELNAEIKPKSTLAPIDIEIEIDGLSGLSCGEYFNIDGVPEIYNQTGVFQITNTKHQITKQEF